MILRTRSKSLPIMRALIGPLMLISLVAAAPSGALAHEAWVLSAEQMAEWDAKPLPDILTNPTAGAWTIYVLSLLFVVGWVLLHRSGARELFPDLQAWLSSYGHVTAPALRFGLAVALILGAFGLNPRHGTEMMSAPVFIVPDLQLNYLDPFWGWLQWLQLAIAVLFVLGLYTRFVAAVFLGFLALGAVLFPYEIWAYMGIVAGAGIFLLLQGAGSLYIPMPEVPGTGRLVAWLENQPRERAMWIMRVLVGLTFIYLGIEYKFLHANLMLAGTLLFDLPTFGMVPETFTLLTAVVETLAGILLLMGLLVRPLAIVLLFAFIFFSIVFREGLLSHSFAYSILVGLFFLGAGRWRRPIATDKPGHIVVLGGSFAGIHAAMRLERVRGQFSNVKVTLVHREPYFLFHPLLADVVGGSVQPGNIVNPIRRLCPATEFVRGTPRSVDTHAKQVEIETEAGEARRLSYDALIVALDRTPGASGVQGLFEHAFTLGNIGDALYLRQRILECLETAEASHDPERRRTVLSFCIIGGGARGCSAAGAIRELVDAAVSSYGTVNRSDVHVSLIEARDEVLPRFPHQMRHAARRRLAKLGVDLHQGVKVSAVTASEVVLESGMRLRAHTTINTLSAEPVLPPILGGSVAEALRQDEFLRLAGSETVFVAGDSAMLGRQQPFHAVREIRMGHRAAHNAWATLQGFRLRRWREWWPLAMSAAMGRHASITYVLGLTWSGRLAWVGARLVCLVTLPGLERNLRVLLDWVMDLVFRNDIAVIAPQPSRRLTRAHFQPGDLIIRQGEEGHSAFVVTSGEVAITREEGGRTLELARLAAGECFGEIALLTDAPRNASARALTPVDLIVLPRDQFLVLSEGYRDLGEALRQRMGKRLEVSLD